MRENVFSAAMHVYCASMVFTAIKRDKLMKTSCCNLMILIRNKLFELSFLVANWYTCNANGFHWGGRDHVIDVRRRVLTRGVLLILYGGGATGPKNSWDILRVKSRIWSWDNFSPIFTGAFAISRYKDLHCTQTIYLAIAGSTYYSISYWNRRILSVSS